MKKTLLSIATVTTLTGVASHNVSAADYTVESGDTPWGLANENGTSVSQLKEKNNLSSDLIVPGEVLEVDGEEEETQVKEENQGIYKIKAGDTLYKIGQKFNVDYKQIKEWNNLSSDMIYAGKTLIVSADAVPTEQKAPVVAEAPTQNESADAQAHSQTAQADNANQQVEPEKTEVQHSSQDNEKAAPAVVEESNQNDTEAVEQPAQTTQSDNANHQVEPKQSETQYSNQNNEKEASTVAQTSNQNRTDNVQQSTNEGAQSANQSSQDDKAPAVAEKTSNAVVENTSNNEVATQNTSSEEATQAPAPQAPAPSAASGSYGTNFYMTGDCTWYVFERRREMGASVSNSWGDAKNWASAARSEGLQVNNTPSVGAIMQSGAFQNGAYSFGHVAVVESVNADGSIVVSEMNWSGGVGNKTTRTVSASNAASHNFIH